MKRKEECPEDGAAAPKKPNVLESKSAVSKLMSRLAEKKAKLESQLKEQEEKKKQQQQQQQESAPIYVAKSTRNIFIPPPMIVGNQGNPLVPGQIGGAPSTTTSGVPVTSQSGGIFRASQKSYYDSVREEQSKIEEENKKNPYWDPRLKPRNKAERSRRAFQFVEPGTYTKIADKERKRIKRQELVDNGILGADSSAADAPHLSAAGDSNAVALGTRTIYSMLDDVPAVEWWDEPFLSGSAAAAAAVSGYPEGLSTAAEGKVGEVPGIDLSKIDSRIEVPPKKAPPKIPGNGDDDDDGELKLYLTKEERKKMRKRRRQARLKEKQEAILIGLQKPPPPKIKLSNMMRVLTAEAVMDPTAVERKVREEATVRKQYRDDMNESRRLTSEQRKEKMEQKLVNNAEEKGYLRVVFKLQPNGLTDPSRRFKVHANAQSLLLRGCGIINPKFNLVIVEGSQWGMNKFKKLMLRRIKWNRNVVKSGQSNVKKEEVKKEGMDEGENEEEEEDDDDDDDDENGGRGRDGAGDPNFCRVLWEGTVDEPAFKSFTFEAEHRTEQELREFLKSKKADVFLDIAKNFDEAKDTKI